MSKGQVLIWLVAVYLRQRLKKSALMDFIKMLNIISPNRVPPTQHFLNVIISFKMTLGLNAFVAYIVKVATKKRKRQVINVTLVKIPLM